MKIKLAIYNPFRYAQWKNIWDKTYKLSSHKYLEFQISKYRYELFSIDVDIEFRGEDHAGPRFEINLLGYIFAMQIYDNRHWNMEKWTYEENPITKD